jgi:hypothetical protein
MTHAQLFLGHSFFIMLASLGFGFNIFSIAFLTSRLVVLSFYRPCWRSSHISCNELWRMCISVTIIDAKKESIFTIFVAWTKAQIKWQYILWSWVTREKHFIMAAKNLIWIKWSLYEPFN